MLESDATIRKDLRVIRHGSAAYDPPAECETPMGSRSQRLFDTLRGLHAANCLAWFSRKSMTWLWAVK
jgi:hypothetical protein